MSTRERIPRSVARFDALAVGDAILDIVTPPLLPGRGDRQSGVGRFAHNPGGNATNFALAFAALGGRTGLVACVGRDWAGDLLMKRYREGRVETRIRRSPAPTGTTLAVAYTDGSRHLITSLGANSDLRSSDVPASWLSSARHVHRAGYWWATGLIGRPTARLLARAQVAGATTSLDIATDPEGWTPSRRKGVLSLLPHVDILFGNEEEITRLGGGRALGDSAGELLDRGAREVVVHRGRRGGTVFSRTGSVHKRAFPVPSRSPTGCGDVFNAAYVTAALAGAPREHRLVIANAAGAWHMENPARPYPTRADLRRRFLATV